MMHCCPSVIPLVIAVLTLGGTCLWTDQRRQVRMEY